MNSIDFLPGSALLTQKRRQLRNRLEVNLDTKKLFKRIDDVWELNGARIVYIDYEFTDVVLREFQPICRKKPITLILREAPISAPTPKDYSAKLKQDQRDSEMVGEIVGATIACGAAVLSWIVIFGSTAAIPLSGGASTAITYLGYAAATASTTQCINGAARIGLEAFSPETKDWLDSEDWYNNASMALDVISVAGAGASSLAALKSYKLAKAASSRSTVEILKGMSRSERKRLTQAIIKLNHPGVSSKVMKALIGAGKYPKRYTQGQISEALALQVKDALGASLSFLGSATSGSGRAIAVGLYEQTIDL